MNDDVATLRAEMAELKRRLDSFERQLDIECKVREAGDREGRDYTNSLVSPINAQLTAQHNAMVAMGAPGLDDSPALPARPPWSRH